jgi:nucleotide-binding universal stress UspA family protein
MNPIRTILAATDFTDEAAHAARRGALLSRTHSAALQLLHVIRLDFLTALRARVQAAPAPEEALLASARRDLDALRTRMAAEASAPPEAIVRTGGLLEEILAAADHADLMMLGAHGPRTASDLLVGTTAERLLVKSRRPMIVVRRPPASGYQRVLVPIDFSMQSLGALNFAQDLAPDARLHLFHVYDDPFENKLRQGDLDAAVIADMQGEFRDAASTNLANIFSKWVREPANAVSSVEAGNPRHLIPERARDDGADVIVLGKHGQSQLGEFFLGGVSRHVLSNVQCDVAIVPDWPRPATS